MILGLFYFDQDIIIVLGSLRMTYSVDGFWHSAIISGIVPTGIYIPTRCRTDRNRARITVRIVAKSKRSTKAAKGQKIEVNSVRGVPDYGLLAPSQEGALPCFGFCSFIILNSPGACGASKINNKWIGQLAARACWHRQRARATGGQRAGGGARKRGSH